MLYRYHPDVAFSALLGKTLTDITVNRDNDQIDFTASDDAKYAMYHKQDCCEYVSIKEVVGDIADLVGSPILQAEEVSQLSGDEGVPAPEDDYDSASYTWTFYKLATIKGSVTISWYGSSNGYYSEGVSFVRTDKGEED